jgi:uncharacterized protein (DUF433 family)
LTPKSWPGSLVIKDTRMAVEFIVELLANGWTIEEVLENYPQLKREDVIAALKYAAEVSKEARPSRDLAS